FVTNPLSLAYGAAGVGYALKKITGKQSEELLGWILRHKIDAENYPPGLFIGLSGGALCLLELSAGPEAGRLFPVAFRHPLLGQAQDIFYGVAGWGLASLHFYLKTGNQLYLDKASEAGNRLLETCSLSPAGYYWKTLGETRFGFAHGASGIALFLLYLH